MRLLFAAGLTIFLLRIVCAAQDPVEVPFRYDDGLTKCALWRDPSVTGQILADRKSYYELEDQLRPLTGNCLTVIFGASRETVPAGYVLPVHHHFSVDLGGAGYCGEGRCSYFLNIGDVGGALVFSNGDGSYNKGVALYLKIDAGFHALRTRADYAARRAWELQRTAALREQILKSFANLVKVPLPKVPSVTEGFDPKSFSLEDSLDVSAKGFGGFERSLYWLTLAELPANCR